jgi:hypothetical protein
LALFFISLSLLPVGTAGREDADDFVLAVVLNGVGDQQQENAVHEAKGLPTALAAFNAVLL